MAKFSKRFLIGIAAVTVVVFILMAASTIAGDKIPIINNIAGIVVTPFQKAINTVTYKVSSTIEFFKDAKNYAQENEDLRIKVLQLEQDSRDMISYRNENERLRELLDMQQRNYTLNLVGASVVSKESGNWYQTIIIDKGSSSGIEKNAVVLVPEGLVGYVYEVGTSWAKVRTVIDVATSVGAICTRTNDKGVAEGNLSLSNSNRCLMRYISKDANIVIGDSIETSGMGGIFPQGILIGEVESISEENQGLSLCAVVKSKVDFQNISEVLVVKGE